MRKRITAIICAALMLCGCNRAKDPAASVVEVLPEAEQVRVWIPEGHMELATQMCKEFTDLHPERRYSIVLAEMRDSEMTVAALKGHEAADVLFFPSARLHELSQAGVLDNADAAAISCGTLVSGAATDGAELRAYPCAADVCFLYYDKALLTDSEAADLTAILDKQLDRGKVNFAADLTDGAYLSSFFLAAGCRPEEPQSFSSESGQLAAELVVALAEDEGFAADMDVRAIKTGFADRKLAAAVSDGESAAAIANSLGKDFGTAKLPAITFSDGSTVQPVTAAGFLLVGVNSESKVSQTAHELAQWLSNRENQLLRLDKLGLIPTDDSIVRDAELMERYPAVRAAHQQLAYGVLLPDSVREAALDEACGEFGCDVLEGDAEDIRDSLEDIVDELL